jgi:hypothetical protein
MRTNESELNILFKDNLLVNLFCDNFIKYKKSILEQLKKNNNINPEQIIFDNFPHPVHIKNRLEFSSLLVSLNLFDNTNIDHINFLYDILIDDAIYEGDKQEFYNYIKKTLEKNSDPKIEEKIFRIFDTKICKDAKSCQTLSLQAFESYLTIFLDINSRANNLSYSSAASVILLLIFIYILERK